MKLFVCAIVLSSPEEFFANEPYNKILKAIYMGLVLPGRKSASALDVDLTGKWQAIVIKKV